MRFFSSLLVGASALVSLAAAQTVKFTWEVPASVTVGNTYNVTYESDSPSTPVTIILRAGISTNLQTISTLTTTATGGSYEWTVSKDLPNGADYALEIKQGSSGDNYSKQFTITGSTATATPSGSSSASGSSTSSSASSSSTASSSKNSTITSATLTATGASKTSSAASSTASGGSAPTGAATNLKSPMALVFGAVAAIAYLH